MPQFERKCLKSIHIERESWIKHTIRGVHMDKAHNLRGEHGKRGIQYERETRINV